MDRIQQDVHSGLVNAPFRLRQRGSSKRGSGLSVQAGEYSNIRALERFNASTLQRFNASTYHAAEGEKDGWFTRLRTSCSDQECSEPLAIGSMHGACVVPPSGDFGSLFRLTNILKHRSALECGSHAATCSTTDPAQAGPPVRRVAGVYIQTISSVTTLRAYRGSGRRLCHGVPHFCTFRLR